MAGGESESGGRLTAHGAAGSDFCLELRSNRLRGGGLRRGLGHGVFLAIVADLLVELNQFIVYEISHDLALMWIGFSVVEFCIWGIINAKIFGSLPNPDTSRHR